MATSQKRFRKDSASEGASDASSILDRAPPYDLTAEKAVLGSILLKPDLASDLSLILRHDDFFDDAHQKLYRKMVEMIDSSRRIDAALLVHELKASNEYELVGGGCLPGGTSARCPEYRPRDLLRRDCADESDSPSIDRRLIHHPARRLRPYDRHERIARQR